MFHRGPLSAIVLLLLSFWKDRRKTAAAKFVSSNQYSPKPREVRFDMVGNTARQTNRFRTVRAIRGKGRLRCKTSLGDL
ncbi:MAG: hypothetical protein CVU57_12295 [Deltaproteobacteria bacterium HGW-Deltaproteobacteria-15]|jgi:hypothetical protein|nr:MAG: hypothetical protein CVU57_12295 [Deltaproteobacteria bacterium HGW-Deltaproteobacteria-15]